MKNHQSDEVNKCRREIKTIHKSNNQLNFRCIAFLANFFKPINYSIKYLNMVVLCYKFHL